MVKVLMCTAANPQEGPHLDIFRNAGFEVGFVPADKDLFREDDLISVIRDADAVVAGSEPYTPRVIEAAPKLRVIVRSGVGFDAVDLAACDQRGIPVCTTPGVNHHSVAEHTIAMLMAVARGFPKLDRKVRENRWNRHAYPRVMGKTLGLLGLGRIGQAVATRGIGLGMNVLAYESLPNTEFVQRWGVELVSFDHLLERSDFVSLHLPMSTAHHHLMNAQTFAQMKRGSVLLNTARGPLVDETALIDALKSGHLAGAGLDVFEVEPLSLDSPLLTLDNVLLSGHIAGLDVESAYDTAKMYAEIIVGLHSGRWPEGCVQNLAGCTGWKW